MSSSGYTGSARSGSDSPARIQTSGVMLTDATTQMPDEPTYQTVIPFFPSIISGNIIDGSQQEPASDEPDRWQRTPSRCDLLFYQGDDVVIPLYFMDPEDPNLDMSDQAEWDWFAQVRTRHSYRSTFVNQFITASSYQPPADPNPGITKVELLLPRAENVYSGVYRWDLYSVSPLDLSRFPKPDDVDPADWPPADATRTWLYGLCTIVPRVTSTDMLPTDSSYTPQVPWPGPPVEVSVLTTGGYFVGPNGRVP